MPSFSSHWMTLGASLARVATRLGHVGEVPAAHDVEVVIVGGVLATLGGGLDAALGHHGVGVAVAQLGGDHDRAPCSWASSAAAVPAPPPPMTSTSVS